MDLSFHALVNVAAVLALSFCANGQTSPISQDSQPVPGLATYELQSSGSGGYQARNAAQRLELQFTPQEAELQYPNASGGLRLTGYGYGQQLQTPADAQLARQGNRVEYLRGDLTEWYVNQADGLEQGFTFARRPAGAEAGEPLVIALAVTGGFTPALASDGQAVLLHSDAGEALRYGGLHTWDARGREVASRMEVRDREIRLIVDDRDAEYPLVVDPIVTPTSTSLTVSRTGPACTPSSLNCTIQGQRVDFSAVVAEMPPGTGPVPNGLLVTFYDGPAVLGVAKTAGGTGTATFHTKLLLAGANCVGSPALPCAHSLTARFDGNASFSQSLSPAALWIIQALPATTFQLPVDYNVDSNAEAMVGGNVDSFSATDNEDLFIANFGSNDVSVLLNSPPGTFPATPNNISGAGRGPRGIAAGVFDQNTNTFPDLAVVDYAQNVTIMLGNGTGNFTASATPLTTGTFPEGIVAADFNGDGIVDLAVTNNGDTPGTVSVFLGKGNGTFTQAPGSPFTVGLGPSGIAVGNFNVLDDKIPDLAVVNEVDGTVSIYLGNNDGTFRVGSITPIGLTANNGESIAVGDFNLDGNPDLVVATVASTSSGATVLLLDGHGNLLTSPGAKATYATGAYPNAVAVGDFNGDGIPDLAVSNGYSNNISILIGKGDGTFPLPAVNYLVGFLPSALVVGDFNNDGITDLAAANFDANVAVLIGENVGITASALSTPQTTQINTAFLQPLIVTTTPPTNGVNVLFTAPSTGASGVFENYDTYVASAITTGTGLATGTATSPIFFANTIAGSYLATAQLGWGPPVTFSLTNTPGSGIVIKIASNSPASESATVNTPFTAILPQVPLSVLVTDSGGNPLTAQTVTFTAPSSGPSGTFPGGVTQVQVMTNSNGIATAPTFTANMKAGTYTVIATVSYASTAFTLTNLPGSATKIVVLKPIAPGESTMVGTAFANPLVAQVQDTYGNPVPYGGLPPSAIPPFAIIFTAPSTGPSGTFSGLSTDTENVDAFGNATSKTLTANNTQGTYFVSATSTSLPSASALFQLTNNAPNVPANIAVALVAAQSATIGTSFPLPLEVLVTDSSSNPVPGVTVTFTAPTSGPTGTFSGPGVTVGPGGTATAITGPAGTTPTVIFTANGITGTYAVTASVATATGTATTTFVLTNAPGIVLPTLTIPLGGTVQFPVTLAQPATRIVYVTLSTGANPTISFNTNTIQFPVGSTTPSYTPEVTANSVGPTTVTASAYLYSSVSTTVTVGP